MEAWRAAAALVLLAALLAPSAAAPVNEQTALETLEDVPNGCYYNFQHYGEGDRIMTNEPCLNCTCHNKMLMCYLRVCPFTKPIGQDCTVEKRGDQCCPVITCPDVPVDLLTSTSTSSPAEYGSTDVGHLEKYGCTIGDKFYSEGSKVPAIPNKPCELCYCIRNMTACVMQECTLHIDGCTPVYHKDVCCPVRYSCDHEDEVPMLDDLTTTVKPTPGFLLTTTMASGISQDCVHDEEVYSDGALIKTDNACEHCYCMKGDIVCAVQECGTPMENEGKNCTALPPRSGQCCPDTYMCENDLEYGTTETDEGATTVGHIEDELSTEKPEIIDDIVSSDHDLKLEDDHKPVTPFDEDTTAKIDEQSKVPDEESFEGSGQHTPEDTETHIDKTTEQPIDEEKTPVTISVVEESVTSGKIPDSDTTERDIIAETESITTPRQVKDSESEYELASTIESVPSFVTETATVSLSISDESSAETITQRGEEVPTEKDTETTERQVTPQTTLINVIEDVDADLKTTTEAQETLVTEADSESDVSNKVTQDLVPVTESLDDKKVATETEQSTENIERQGTQTPQPESENEIIDEYPEPAQILPHIPGEGDCLVDGVTYTNDSLIPSENKCQKSCRCVSSIVKCEKIECSPPPKNIMNCEPMYDSNDSCCPTYVCDRVKETIPPESDSQISHVSTESYPSPDVVSHETPSSEEKEDDIPSTETDQKHTPTVEDKAHPTVVEYEKETTPATHYVSVPESPVTDSFNKDTDLDSTTGEKIHEVIPEIDISTIKTPQESSPEIAPQEPTPVTDSGLVNEDGSDKLQTEPENLPEVEPTTGYIVPDKKIDEHLPEELPTATESHTTLVDTSSKIQPDRKTESPISDLDESVTSITQSEEDQTHVTDSSDLVVEEETQETTPESHGPKVETPVVASEDNIPDSTGTPIVQETHDHTSPDEVQHELVTIPGMLETDVSVTDVPQYTHIADYSPSVDTGKEHTADTEGPKTDTSIGETPEYSVTGKPQEPSITVVSSSQEYTPTDKVTQIPGDLDLQTDVPKAPVSGYDVLPEDESSTEAALHLTPIDDNIQGPVSETHPETEQPSVLEHLSTTVASEEGSAGVHVPPEQTPDINIPESHDAKGPELPTSSEQPISEDEMVTATLHQYTLDGESPEHILPGDGESPFYSSSPTPHSDLPITSQGDISSHDVPKDDITIAHSTSGYTSDEVTHSYTYAEDQTDKQSLDVTPVVSHDAEAPTIGSDNLEPESHVTISHDESDTDVTQKISHVTESSVDHTLPGEDIQQHTTEAEGYDYSSVSNLPIDESSNTGIPADLSPVGQDQEGDSITKAPEDHTLITESVSEESIPIHGHIPEDVPTPVPSLTDIEGITPSTEDHTPGIDISPDQTPAYDDSRTPSTIDAQIPEEDTDIKHVSDTKIPVDDTTPNVLDQVQTEVSELGLDESPQVTISDEDSKYHTQLPFDSETSTPVEQSPDKEEVKTDSPYLTSGADDGSEVSQEYSTIADDKHPFEVATSEISQSVTSSYTPTTDSSVSLTDSGKDVIEDNISATDVPEEKKDQSPTAGETDIKSCAGDKPCAEGDKPSSEEHTPIIDTKTCNGNEPCTEDDKSSIEGHTPVVDATDVKLCNGDEPCTDSDKPLVEGQTPEGDTTKLCNGQPCIEDDKSSADEHTPIVGTIEVTLCNGDEPCAESVKPPTEEHTHEVDTEEHTTIVGITDIKLCNGDEPCSESDKPSMEDHTPKVDTTDIKSCDGDKPCTGYDKPSIEEHIPIVDTTDVKLCDGDKPCAESDKQSSDDHTPTIDTTEIKSCNGDEPCIGRDKTPDDGHIVDTTDVKLCNGDEPCSESDKPSMEDHTPKVDTTDIKSCDGDEPCTGYDKPAIEEHTSVVGITDVKLCDEDKPCAESDKPLTEGEVDTTNIKSCNGDEPCVEHEKPSIDEHTQIVDSTEVKLCNGDELCVETDKPVVEEHGVDRPAVEEPGTKVDTTDVKACDGDKPCSEDHKPSVDTTEIKPCDGDESCIRDDRPSTAEHTPEVVVDTTDIKTCTGGEPCTGVDETSIEVHTPKVDTTKIKPCDGEEPCTVDKPSSEEQKPVFDTTDIKSCNGDEPCVEDNKPTDEEHAPLDTTDIKACDGDQPCTGDDKPVVEEQAPVVDTTKIKSCNGIEPCVERTPQSEDEPLFDDHTSSSITGITDSHDQEKEKVTAGVAVPEHQTLSSERLNEETTASSVLQESSNADEEISKDDSGPTEATKISDDEQPSTSTVIDSLDEKTSPEESIELTTTVGSILDKQPSTSNIPQEDISETGVPQEDTLVTLPDQNVDIAISEEPTISPASDSRITEGETPTSDISEEVTPIDSGAYVTPSDVTEVSKTDETIPKVELPQQQTVEPDVAHEEPESTEAPLKTDTTEVDSSQEQITDTKHTVEQPEDKTEGPSTELPVSEIEQHPDDSHTLEYEPVTGGYQPDSVKIDTSEEEISKTPTTETSGKDDMKGPVDESQIPITESGQETVPANLPVNLDESEECKYGKCVHITDEFKPTDSTPNIQEDIRDCEGAYCDSSTQTNILEEGSGSEPTDKPAPVLDDKITPVLTDEVSIVKPQEEEESTAVDSEKTTSAPIVTEALHKDTTELSGDTEHVTPTIADSKTPLPTLPEKIDSQESEQPTTPSILKSEDMVTEKILEITTISQIDTSELDNKITDLDTKPEISTVVQSTDSVVESTTKVNVIDDNENEIISIPVLISEDATEGKPKPIAIDIPIKDDTTTAMDETFTTHAAPESSSPTRIPDETVSENIRDTKPEGEIDSTSEISKTEQTTPSILDYTAKVDDTQAGITLVQTEIPVVSDHTSVVSVAVADETTDKVKPTDLTDHETEPDVSVHLPTATPLYERITTLASIDEVSESEVEEDKKPTDGDSSTEYDEEHVTQYLPDITPSPVDSKTTIAEVQSSHVDSDYSETTQHSVEKVTLTAVTQINDDDKEYTKVPEIISETLGVTTQYPKDVIEYESTDKLTTEEDIGVNVIETETDAPYKPSDDNIPRDDIIPEKSEKPVDTSKPDDEEKHISEKVTTDSEVNKVTTIGDDIFIGQTTLAEGQKELTTLSSIDEATSSPKIESDYDVTPTKDSSAPEHEPSTNVPIHPSPEIVMTESSDVDVTTKKTQTVTISSESQVTEYTPSKDEQSTLPPTQDKVADDTSTSLGEDENIPSEILRHPTTISTPQDVEISPIQNEYIPVHVSVTSTDVPAHVDEHVTEKTHISTIDDSRSHVPKITTITPTEEATTIIHDLTSQQESDEPTDSGKHEADVTGIVDTSSTLGFKEEEIQPVTDGIQIVSEEPETKLTTKSTISDDNIVTDEDVATEKSPSSDGLEVTTPQSQKYDIVTKQPITPTDDIETTVSLIDNEIIEGPSKDTYQPLSPVTDSVIALVDDHKPDVDKEVSPTLTGEDSTTVVSDMSGVTSSDNQATFEESSTTFPKSDDSTSTHTETIITDVERKPTLSPITDKPSDGQEIVTHPSDTGIIEGDVVEGTPISQTLVPSSVTDKEEIDVTSTTNVADTANKQETSSDKPAVPTVSYLPENTGTVLFDDSLKETSVKETSTQHDELTKAPIEEESLPSEATSQSPISDEITETDKIKDEDFGQAPETGPSTEIPISISSSAQPDESYGSPHTDSTHIDIDDIRHTISHEPGHKDEDATDAPTPQQTLSHETVDFVPITAILGIPTTERNVVVTKDTEPSTIAPEVSIADVEVPSAPTDEEGEKTTAEDVSNVTSHSSPVTQLYNEPVATEAPLPATSKPDIQKPSHEVEAPVSKPEKPGKHGTSTAPTVDLPSPEHDLEHQAPGYGSDEDYDEDQAFGPGTCRYGGKVYVSAQQIPRDDPCDFCFCFRSDIICLQQSCPPPIHGCHEEPISGFCCPRYECPVSMATTLNITTTTTTTTTTLPPHFLPHAYKGAAARRGCQIKGHSYAVGEVVKASSGPCLHCTCGGDGQMKCDPKVCTPEPMLRQMIAAAVSTKRRR